jgi:RNA polymerase sigma-70 factor (ECF subfamily)
MSSVPNPLVAPVRAEAQCEARLTAERAQQDVAALYSERGGELLNYALAVARNEELARDAIQEAFMRYFVARCEGAEIVAPRPWMYRVIHNYLLDCMRQSRSREDAELRRVPARGPDIEDECMRREIFDLARRKLSPREYDCFRLRTQGLGYEEIATQLDLKSGTVGALISRAINKLRNFGFSLGVRA